MSKLQIARSAVADLAGPAGPGGPLTKRYMWNKLTFLRLNAFALPLEAG
jgi:hypothetical protein